MPYDLTTLNQLPSDEFVRVAGPLFEHSPWIAERAATQRPFESVEKLHASLVAVITEATPDEQVGLIAAHPDLAGKLAVAGRLTADSTAEQKSARLDRLTPEQFDRITALNEAYREKFGFPFVICVLDHQQDEIFDAFETRVAHGREEEIAAALFQIGRIGWHRLQGLLATEQTSTGRLSTHVLDTAHGHPAAGMKLSLWRQEGAEWTEVLTTETNADGRTDGPLLNDGNLTAGVYELRFQVGAYFATKGVAATEPAFLDVVPIRFGIADADANYHVPLLASPWSYGTYRGS